MGGTSWVGVHATAKRSLPTFFCVSTSVNIDDCWQASTRDAVTDELVADPAKFPHGIKAVADYVHSRGLLLGICKSPASWHQGRKGNLLPSLTEDLTRSDTSRGDHTCQGRPGSRDHEALDARTFADWGVDYLKDGESSDAPRAKIVSSASTWWQARH